MTAIPNGLFGVIARKNGAGGGGTPTYGVEGFEGTGEPASWSNTIVASGTVDYDDTVDPGTGTKSLEVITSGGDSYAELDLGSLYTKFKLIFQCKIASGGSNRQWIKMCPVDSFYTNGTGQIGFVNGWDWGFTNNGQDLLPTTSAVSVGAWHWIKFEVDISTSEATIMKSASSDFSSPDTVTDASFSFHAGFTGIRYLRFGAISRSMSVWIDEVSAYDL